MMRISPIFFNFNLYDMNLFLSDPNRFEEHKNLCILVLDTQDIVYEFRENIFFIDMKENITLTCYNTAQALKLLGAEFIIID